MKFLCLSFTIDSGAHYGAARGAALPGPIHFISATSVYERLLREHYTFFCILTRLHSLL